MKVPKWEGPIQIGKVGTNFLRPSEKPGIYVTSKRGWSSQPNKKAGILYVGKGGILRWRVGTLVAVLLGFAPEPNSRYLHGKARRIFHKECSSDIANSAKLYVGWRVIADGDCVDWREAELFHQLSPEYYDKVSEVF